MSGEDAATLPLLLGPPPRTLAVLPVSCVPGIATGSAKTEMLVAKSSSTSRWRKHFQSLRGSSWVVHVAHLVTAPFELRRTQT